jgi:hypothetical protein
MALTGPAVGLRAAAWNRGRATSGKTCTKSGRLGGGPSGSAVQEVRLAASREVLDHRRRMLEHQEKVEAEQHTQAVPPLDPQLRMRLIGEVRSPEPSPPKRRRSRTNKPVQPELGET